MLQSESDSRYGKSVFLKNFKNTAEVILEERKVEAEKIKVFGRKNK